jgi:hypothetical protein
MRTVEVAVILLKTFGLQCILKQISLPNYIYYLYILQLLELQRLTATFFLFSQL